MFQNKIIFDEIQYEVFLYIFFGVGGGGQEWRTVCRRVQSDEENMQRIIIFKNNFNVIPIYDEVCKIPLYSNCQLFL